MWSNQEMYRNNGSYGPPSRGFSSEEPSPRSSISRPSARSIYMQRREYSESVTKQPDNFQHRVEHLLTCELDGQRTQSVEDCLASLKQLNTKGKVWAQNMLLEVQGRYLQLSDIETKEKLDSLAVGSITNTAAVLDSCAYNSILTITLQENPRKLPQVFMFQCAETGAQDIKDDLDKAIQQGGSFGPDPHLQRDIRSDLENLIGQKRPGSFRPTGVPPFQPERTPSPPNYPPPHWNNMNDYDDQRMPPLLFRSDSQRSWRDPEPPGPPYEPQYEPAPTQSNTERNVDILNHVLSDTERFMGIVIAACQEELQGKKKNKKKKNKKSGGESGNLPPFEEYVSFLQKNKYGFNLLGKLNGEISNPSAPEFVHCFFTMLNSVVPCYPRNIPPTVLSPFLTEPALLLLSHTVTNEEDQLWRSLGDCWNVPRHSWPNSDQIPPYTPVFYDGWELPPPNPAPNQNRPVHRGNSQIQGFSSRNDMQEPPHQNVDGEYENDRILCSAHHIVKQQLVLIDEDKDSSEQMGWNSPPPRSAEPSLQMQVIYDFMARNSRELSVMKGDVIEVTDKSGQWWKVRNVRGEAGYVPQNVLQPLDEPKETRGPPTLTISSKPPEVRAWLEYKGFSKLTVKTLGVLSGELLLKMTRDEIRIVCPEEGGRVFFQLQPVKSSVALADENGYNYGY